ncbi:tRNA lysidine(34) synthetase TilS [Sporolactobacillus putidus]|uniref:tRNA(Ile)-lysidine synthase n=1 Tax=Sporolactobacillus putidus TaxID=492735 RepID=A0A917W5B3_9BACL|nr:tRNA lysidine(34) synthetase TilS [Sporolactobacillus putidus]GGL64256.1 tRNA(Ile)-lysidine synthase [Sporolactobacillus putidus]
MTFEESVTQFIRNHGLIHPRMRLVAGVSGGADSMALLQYLCGKRKAWELELAVCSVDHGLRGVSGREDLAFVASFCQRENIVFFGKTVDVRAYCTKKHLGIEAAARELRYQAFEEALGGFGADALVLAHHGDDQIETMLMREVRGRIGIARSGIPVRRPFAGKELIRPLLSQTKSALEAYCAAHGLKPRHDATNESDRHTRNRFRKQVLPFLKQENPSVHLKFQYESETIAEDEAFLLRLAEQQLGSVILEKSADQVKISVPDLLIIPFSLQRRIIHLILNYLYTNRKIQPMHQSIHIENLLQLLRSGRSSGHAVFPEGLSARKSYEVCLIGFLSRVVDKSYDIVLRVPGRTLFSAGTIEAEFLPGGFCVGTAVTGPDSIIIDYHNVAGPLRVRTWQPGDRMMPSGMTGTQKIQRIFINEKIDREKRFIWPLVVDGKDSVLWLPLLRRGWRSSLEVQKREACYLKLTFTPIDDLGRIKA